MLALPDRVIVPGDVLCMDALELLARLPCHSADAIITDLPYGTTACSWDEIVPFAPLWAAVKHALKPRGVFVTTASQPFTSKLVMSNLDWYHEGLVWDKVLAVGFLDANRKHMKRHEDILVFCDGMPIFTPQMTRGEPYTRPNRPNTPIYGAFKETPTINLTGDRYPKSILEFSNADRTNTTHPTQKPLALMSYLIATYTRPGDLVVDPFAGSGTTLVAARNLGRRYIGGDITPAYCDVARQRLAEPYTASFLTTETSEPLPTQAAIWEE